MSAILILVCVRRAELVFSDRVLAALDPAHYAVPQIP